MRRIIFLFLLVAGALVASEKVVIRPLNTLEVAECLMDVGCSGNLNFAVISSYKGDIDYGHVEEAARYLQAMHPLLRATVDISENTGDFLQTSEEVSIAEYSYEGADQWRAITRNDLAKRFDIANELLWRVLVLKGNNEGQIVFSFHHAIADGVCAMQLMDHFYQILDDLLQGKEVKIEPFDSVCDLDDVRSLLPKESSEAFSFPTREDRGYHTTYVKDQVDPITTRYLIDWTKSQGIKVHATLFAAFLKAIDAITNPGFEEFLAVTAVNYRPFFSPPFSKDTQALLRTCISDSFSLDKNDFPSLAKAIHHKVHGQLARGNHISNLKQTTQFLEKKVTPQELWRGAEFPSNAMIITNLGALDFSGEYSKITLEELFFVANVEPFISEESNFVLGTVAYRGAISLSLWFLEELVDDATATAILAKMKQILAEETTPKSEETSLANTPNF